MADADEMLKIALAQCNVTVGDISGNRDKILRLYEEAAGQGADLVIFPEMVITGYPPEDLVLRESFRRYAMQALQELAQATDGNSNNTAMLVGGLWHDEQGLRNSAFLLENGKIQFCYHKQELPNYGVFDEKRLFIAGDMAGLIKWRGLRLGVFICEDMWHQQFVSALAAQHPDIVISINASPYEMGKIHRRVDLAKSVAGQVGAPLIYLNLVGGQDELVFDGRSFIISTQGEKLARLAGFSESLTLTEWRKNKKEEAAETTNTEQDSAAAGWQLTTAPPFSSLTGNEETIYCAMMLGLKDYVEKSGFPGVIISLSGGVDSALTAAVAVDALGAQRVHTVMMPSPYTSAESLEDAARCAELLGVSYDIINITPAMEIMDGLLADIFAGCKRDTTEENIQARLRANLLMAISNKRGWMVVTTGNKSEMSVGYATLYGDMCGGYSVLKDVYKTTVYKLCRWRNKHLPRGALGAAGEVMPQRVITKAPSAELKPNQKDQDSLPPYEVLDAILQALIEEQVGIDNLVARGFAREVVEQVNHMLYSAEYKRRQAPPGVKVSAMSFDRERRYPIVNKFRG